MSSFPWQELLPELQNIIRQDGLGPQDALSRAMLGLTCKTEHANWCSDVYVVEWFADACTNGHLSIVQWVVKELRTKDDLYYMNALEYGHFEIANWCFAHGLPKGAIYEIHALVNHGNVAALRWLVAHGHVFESRILWHVCTLETAHYLVNEIGLKPTVQMLDVQLEMLPASRDIVCYYLDIGLVPFNIRIFGQGVLDGDAVILELLNHVKLATYKYSIKMCVDVLRAGY